MPFKSASQLRKFGAMTGRGEIFKTKFKQWGDETPSVSGLPERASAASRVRSKMEKTPTGLNKLKPRKKLGRV